MKFRKTDIDGLLFVDLDRHEDERGFFARTYCAGEFKSQNLNTCWAQCNLSHSIRMGTLRGLHYQASPEPEHKLILVTRGRIFGAVVDLRLPGEGFGSRLCFTLSDVDGTMLYVPAGCGFGFQTLIDETDVFYQMSTYYRPELARGVRWDDPALAIPWPLSPTCMSARDEELPRLRDNAPVQV